MATTLTALPVAATAQTTTETFTLDTRTIIAVDTDQGGRGARDKPLGDDLDLASRFAWRSGAFTGPAPRGQGALPTRPPVGPFWTPLMPLIGDAGIVRLDAKVTRKVGAQRLSGTVAVFGYNDTAGTLRAARGWTLREGKAGGIATPRPVVDLANRTGWYAKLDWSPFQWLDVDAVHYDNGANPDAVTPRLQWGWDTKFTTIGSALSLGKWDLRVQGLAGRTLMGFPENEALWINTAFRAGYVMATRKFARGSASFRVEAFGTSSEGAEGDNNWSENGWALSAAARRDIGPSLSVLVEALHLTSRKDVLSAVGLNPDQDETQVQVALRMHL